MSDLPSIPEPTRPAGPPKHLGAPAAALGSLLAGQLISPWSFKTTAIVSACVAVVAAVAYIGLRVRGELRYRREIAEWEREKHRREHAAGARLVTEALERIEALEGELADLRVRTDARWKDTKTISAGREFVEQILNAPDGSYGAAVRDGFVTRSEPRSGFFAAPMRGSGQTKPGRALAAALAAGRPGAEHRPGGPRPGDPQ